MMAGFDTAMFRQNPLRSAAEYQGDYQKLDLNRQVMAENALKLRGQQQAAEQQAMLDNQLRMGVDPRTPEGQAALLRMSGSAAMPTIKSAGDMLNVQGQAAQHNAAAGKSAMEARVLGRKALVGDLALAPDAETATAVIMEWQKKGVVGPAPEKMIADVQAAWADPAKRQAWLQDAMKAASNPDVVVAQAAAGERTAATVAGGAANTAATIAAADKRARLMRESQERVASMPARTGAGGGKSEPVVAVLDEQGNAEFVPRSEAAGRTPANMGGGISPKDKQKREASFPVSTQKVSTFEGTSDVLIKDLETLRDHPGLASITGIAAGRLPGVTANGRAAEALLDKIIARGGFQELQDLRAASPTGGALGSVSNQEGAQLKAAFGALDRKQEAKDFRAAVNDAVAKVKAAKKNVRDAYDLTYEYRARDSKSRPSLESFNK